MYSDDMLQTGEDIPGCLLQSCHRALALSAHGIRYFRRGCSCATETSWLDRTLCDDADPGGDRHLARGKERDWSSYGLPKPRLEFGSMCGQQQHDLSGQAVSPKSDLDGKGYVHIPEGRSVLFLQLLTPRCWLQRSGPVSVRFVADQFRARMLRKSKRLLGSPLRGGPEHSAASVVFRHRHNVYRAR